MPQNTLIRMQDIANRAGVGRTTVSLALRNHEKISVETRRRIQKIARDMGYRPNPLVSAHMAHIRALHPRDIGQCLAFIVNRSVAQMREDYRWPAWQYFVGAQQRANELGYTMESFNLGEPGMTGRRLSRILTARGIQGVLIAPLSEGVGLDGFDLDWRSFSLATIEHTFMEPRLHKTCSDEFSTIGRLIQRLLDYGYVRIGIAMHSRMDDHANHFWLAGYQTFQALTEERLRIPHFITPAWEQAGFLRWYRKHKPEAIITVNDDILRWLRDAGVDVPREVGCATIYWKEYRAELSGFYQNHELMGAGAVDLIVGQLNRNERGLPENDKTMLVQAVWRDGATLCRHTPADARAELRIWTR